jgi:DNA-binding transcriptional MerR regulator
MLTSFQGFGWQLNLWNKHLSQNKPIYDKMQDIFYIFSENSGDSMKTGVVAKRFNVDPNTITAWTDRFADFFTSEAMARDKTQRDYQPEDIVVLNTIRVERIKNTKWDEILEILKSGRREGELPPEFATIDAANALTVYTEIRDLKTLLSNANAEIERLREDNTAQRKRLEDLIRDAADVERLREDNTTQRKRIEDLIAEAKDAEAAQQKRIEDLIRESTEWRIRFEIEKERRAEQEKPSDAQ